MYQTILSHQSAETGGGDKFAINNQLQQNLTAEEKFQIFRILDTENYHEMKLSPICKKILGINSSFRIYKNARNEILISSNFDTLDDKGRKVVYMFYHNSSKNPNDVCLLLSDHASLLGMKVNETDLKLTNKILEAYSHKKTIEVVLLCIVLFATILGISKCNNSKAGREISQNSTEYIKH